MNKNLLYRSIPKVDVLLESQTIQEMIERYSRDSVMEAILQMRQEKERYTETMCCRRAKQFDQKNCYESYVALYEDVLKNG